MLRLFGFKWNDEAQMIECERQSYDDFCKGHPKAGGLWRTKFPYLDRLDLIFGVDRAIGVEVEDIAESVNNLDNEEIVNLGNDANEPNKKKLKKDNGKGKESAEICAINKMASKMPAGAMEEEKQRLLSCEEISSRFVAGIVENADMAEIEESEKGLGDVKKEEVADTLEPKLLEEEQELAGSKLLPESGGIGGQNFVVARQQPDEFGGQESEGVQKMDEEEDEDEDEFDGPPPGWGSSLPPPLPPSPAVKVEQEQQCEGGRRHLKLQELGEKQQLDETEERREKVKQEDEEQLEDEDDIEGPPPGWGSTLQPQHPPSPINQSFPPFCPPGTQDKVEDDDDDDQMEGPPPGWASPLWQLRPSTTPPHGQCLNPLPPSKRAHVYCKSCRRHLSYPQGSTCVQCSTCQIVNQAIEERAQMVCGFCRRLLSYPQGSRFIQCSLCKQVNYVLQEHEVGQVKCENCSELLMYPNGAPSVRCTKCHFVTDVGEHNRRLPLSVQQGRASSGTLAH